MWTLYGLVATHDILLWLPNGLGIILAVTQLIVKGIFSPFDLRCTSLFGSFFGSSHTTGTSSTLLKRPLTPSGARRGATLIHIHDDDLNGTGVGSSDSGGGDVYGIHMLVQHGNCSSSHKLVEQEGGGQASPTDYTPCP